MCNEAMECFFVIKGIFGDSRHLFLSDRRIKAIHTICNLKEISLLRSISLCEKALKLSRFRLANTEAGTL